jgi:flagellar capping protein FliD
MGVDISNSAGVAVFFGSATGGGFLKAATNALNNLENTTTGLLKNAETDWKSQITNVGTQISTKQTQVDQMQTQLTSQMAAADAAIASMEQQYSYLSQMFAAQQTASQQYK